MESAWELFAHALHYILPSLVVLSVVVFVHEFGHFWVARRCGVRVESFSLGFGGEIFGWNDRHGTRWKVAWLPLGGYVKMFGDADPASAGVDEKVADFTEEEKKVAFYSQRLAKRFAIVSAGPVTNYLFAVVVLAGLFATFGQPHTSTVVEQIAPESAAARAGIEPGERVTAVDGRGIDSFEELKRVIAMNLGTPISIALERDGFTRQVVVTPDVVRTTDRLGGEHAMGKLGLMSSEQVFRELSFGQALINAGVETADITVEALRGLGQMLIGVRSSDELGGPLRIAQMSGNVAKDGMAAFIWFIAVLSINLGLLNLFPIPMLDGGHLAFYLAEGLRGQPLDEKVQDVGFKVGFGVVASLMLFATWNDLVHLRVIAFLHGLFS